MRSLAGGCCGRCASLHAHASFHTLEAARSSARPWHQHDCAAAPRRCTAIRTCRSPPTCAKESARRPALPRPASSCASASARASWLAPSTPCSAPPAAPHTRGLAHLVAQARSPSQAGIERPCYTSVGRPNGCDVDANLFEFKEACMGQRARTPCQQLLRSGMCP
eukprot:363790-Chlamydomonas_euryale.AAC.4